MKLSEILNQERISLDIRSTNKEGVLKELVKLLGLSSGAQKGLASTLAAREDLGSTGVGSGIAIPHCRSLLVSELMVAIGRSKTGVNFQSMDGKVAQVAGRLAKDKRLKGLKQRKQLVDIVKELEE